MISQQSLVLYGHYSRCEFHASYHDLLEIVAARRSLVLQPHSLLDEQELPLLCTFLYQSYPGEFSMAFLRQLTSFAPLAPIVYILGAACQGESRTGRPHPFGLRLYACQWNTFHRQQLQNLAEGRPSLFSLPPSYGDDEIILAQAELAACSNQSTTETVTGHVPECNNGTNRRGRYLVLARFGPLGNDSAMNHYLAELYTRQGFQVEIGFDVRDHRSRLPALILADADDSPFPEILKAIQRLRTRFVDTDISVCINSPRINEIVALQSIGVRTVDKR